LLVLPLLCPAAAHDGGVVANGAPGGRTQQGMVPGDMAGHTAHRGAGQAADRAGLLGCHDEPGGHQGRNDEN
jgi:hypothetical protein